MSGHEKFIMLPYAVYDSPAFAELKPIEIAVLLLLIRKHTGHNNGNISLGLRVSNAAVAVRRPPGELSRPCKTPI
jgi:hypothetical protein